MQNLNYIKLLLLLMQIEDLLDEFDIEYIAIKRNKK
jgi:hypothetical protein